MAWRDNLRESSFRGVPFNVVDGGTLTAGRRLARHEYPQRDIPYLEDMGRKAREYKVEAIVVEPGYMAKRDALIRAIEAAGPGQLVHPYYGTLQVVVSGECQITESTQQGGMAKIAITFIEAGQQLEPTATADTRAALDAQHDACDDAFAGDFARKFNTSGKPDYVVQDGLKSVNSALLMPGMAMGNLAWIRANPTSALSALLPENLQSSLGNPLGLARGILLLVRNSSNVLSLFSYSNPPVATGVYTSARLAQNDNRDAFSSLMLQAATAQRVMDLTSTTPATVDDARAARAEIVSRTDAVLFNPSTSQASADALVQLRTDAVAHFAAITPSLPRITTVVPQAVRPAVVQAYDFYGDDWLSAGREDDLITRNSVRNPGFVPAGEPLSLVT
jgi:prophage DNA circulation protein